jgi:hypothetical protein
LTGNDAPRHGRIEEQLLAHGAKVQKKLQKRRDDDVDAMKSAKPRINSNTDKLLAQRYGRLQKTEGELLSIDCPDEIYDDHHDMLEDDGQRLTSKYSPDMNKFEVIMEEKEEEDPKCSMREAEDPKQLISAMSRTSPRFMASPRHKNKSPCHRLNRDQTERSPKNATSSLSYIELYQRRKTAAALIPHSTRKAA